MKSRHRTSTSPEWTKISHIVRRTTAASRLLSGLKAMLHGAVFHSTYVVGCSCLKWYYTLCNR